MSQGEENHGKFSNEVGKKEKRKLRSRTEGDRSIIFGLGMLGLIGWAIAVPVLIGIALGVWLDARHRTGFSWTLTFLFIGLILGCINAWYWVRKASRRQ
ncbi:MAG: AtpZ/AtpI family protein [Nitrospiraceae bacterium]|nr:AtpZ/AtpI family protein [Nitrospiraceae bacterium]